MQHRQQGNCSRHNQGQRQDPHGGQRRKPIIRTGDKNMHSEEKCGWYGGDRHSRAKCPAKDEICHNYKAKGHFMQFAEIEICQLFEEDNSMDLAFQTWY